LIGPFLYFKIGSMGFFTLFNKGLIWYSIWEMVWPNFVICSFDNCFLELVAPILFALTLVLLASHSSQLIFGSWSEHQKLPIHMLAFWFSNNGSSKQHHEFLVDFVLPNDQIINLFNQFYCLCIWAVVVLPTILVESGPKTIDSIFKFTLALVTNNTSSPSLWRL
jgi:hypothetical protein